jgi:hypothetical protein
MKQVSSGSIFSNKVQKYSSSSHVVEHNSFWDDASNIATFAPLTFSSLRPIANKYSLWKSIKYIFYVGWSMATGRWFFTKVAQNLEGNGIELYDRMINEWATMGVIASLLLSFIFPTFTSAIENPEGYYYAGIPGQKFVAILAFISVCFFIVSICIVIVLSMALMTIPKEMSTMFVSEFSVIITFPEICKVSGLYVVVLYTIFAAHLIYGSLVRNYVIPLAVLSAIVALTVWLSVVLILDRKGGLWSYAKFLRDKEKGSNKLVVPFLSNGCKIKQQAI